MGLLALMAFLVRGLIIERVRCALIVPAGVTQVVVGRGRNTRQFTPDATGVFRGAIWESL